jgi:hypothetical protein
MPIDYKIDRRRRVSFKKRDQYGISSKEMIDVKVFLQATEITAKLIKQLRIDRERNKSKIEKLYRLLAAINESLSELLRIEVPDNDRLLTKAKVPAKTFFDFDREGYSSKFRFHSPEDLLRFSRGFGFPDVVRIQRYRFISDEIVLIGLSRLAYPLRWSDIQERFPGKCQKAMQLAFKYFLDFCIVNWGYLILNNRDYWVPHMVEQADAIRVKLANLSWQNWRLFYPAADQPGGFNIFAFIDNTMIAMSRPGGGSVTDGEAAPRVGKDVQQA